MKADLIINMFLALIHLITTTSLARLGILRLYNVNAHHSKRFGETQRQMSSRRGLVPQAIGLDPRRQENIRTLSFNRRLTWLQSSHEKRYYHQFHCERASDRNP
jgi:hypothetical protein